MLVQLFQHILRLPTKIFQFLNLGVLGVLLSVLFYDALSFPHKEKVIFIILIILAQLLFIVVIAQTLQWLFLLLACHGKSIFGKSCEYICQFEGVSGTLETDVYFNLMNISFSPQRMILHDAEGFAVETNFLPKYSMIKRSTNPDGKLIPMYPSNKPEFKKLQDYAGGIMIHQAEWPVLIDPPLLPFEKVSFLRHSKDENVEQRAFSLNGTVFMYRCRIPYRRLTITIMAPIGYRAYDIVPSVDDDSGKKISAKPFTRDLKVMGQRTIIWEIPFPGTHRRYKVAFKLSKLDS